MMASLNDRKQTNISLTFLVSFRTSDFIPNVKSFTAYMSFLTFVIVATANWVIFNVD